MPSLFCGASMSRFARRKDSNHNDIAAACVRVGAEVLDLSPLPGALDLIVGYRGRLVWLEVKDGDKPPSDRKLTDAERATIERFSRVGCPVYKVETEDEALQAIGAI